MLLASFFQGMFPLDMLPEPWASIVYYLPLKYLAYFPAWLFLEKIEGSQLAGELLLEFAWMVFFIVLARWMYCSRYPSLQWIRRLINSHGIQESRLPSRLSNICSK